MKDKDFEFMMYRWRMTLLFCASAIVAGLALYAIGKGVLCLLDVLLKLGA